MTDLTLAKYRDCVRAWQNLGYYKCPLDAELLEADEFEGTFVLSCPICLITYISNKIDKLDLSYPDKKEGMIDE